MKGASSLSLVLAVFSFESCYSHYIAVPVLANGQLLAPYHYVIQHPVFLESPGPVVPPVLSEPDAGPISRETLEDTGPDDFLQNIPDISDEQAHLNPDADDTQYQEEPDIQKTVIPDVPPPARQRPPSHPRPHLPRPQQPQQPLRPSRPQPEEVPNVIFNGPQADGSYDFTYTVDGQSRSEKSDGQGNVEGTYTYQDPDGKDVSITYTAGSNKGYIPVGEGLLPPPPAHPQPDDEGEEGQEPETPHIPLVPDDDDTQQNIVPPDNDGGVQIPEGGDDGGDEGGHGGMPYSYNYDAGLSSKTETADDSGNVEGSYTYVDGAGKMRTVSYTVRGKEGFVATGDIHPDPGSGDQPGLPGNDGSVSKHPPPTPGQGDRTPVSGGGVKGKPKPTKTTPPPVSKGGRKSGWNKYPLGG